MKMEMVIAGFVLASCPAAWAQTPEGMPPNTWLDVPDSHMRAVAPTQGQFAGTWGVMGPAGIIAAWGGAALDTQRSRLVVWGGGHADYCGNEVYVFDIGTLTWSRLTDPTVNPTLDSDVNWDGTPNSRHTYNGLAYIAHADRFFALGGSLAGSGFARCDNTWTFDFTTNTWTNRSPSSTPGGGFGCNCSYDPATKKIWWGSAATNFAGLWSYDYDTNTWAKRNSDNFYEYTSAMDTKRGVLVVVGNGQVFSYDVKNASFAKQAWSTTGGDSFVAKGKPGLDYDPVTDRIVGWAGGAVYALDPASKVWTSSDPPGAPAATEAGIYGRWRYVPSVNAFVVVTQVDANVHFYKMSAGGGGTPPPSAPTVVTSDPTALTSTTATLNGDLTSTGGATTTVKIHWGDDDAGTGAWDTVVDLGAKTAGAFSTNVTGLSGSTAYYYRASATNSAGTSWGVVKSFTTPAATAARHVKINCGTDSFTPAGWEDDSAYVSGGADYDWSGPISAAGVPGAAPEEVYQTVCHLGPHQYTIPLASGPYILRLHLCDLYGERDVTYVVEGRTVAEHLDYATAAGGLGRAVALDFPVAPAEGVLTIECTGGGSYPDVFEAGIELIPVTFPDSDLDGMDDDWELAHFGDLSADGTGDADGDGTSEYWEFVGGTDPGGAPSDESGSGGDASADAGLSCGGARTAAGGMWALLLLAASLWAAVKPHRWRPH